jgi:hypothetical protein
LHGSKKKIKKSNVRERERDTWIKRDVIHLFNKELIATLAMLKHETYNMKTMWNNETKLLLEYNFGKTSCMR